MKVGREDETRSARDQPMLQASRVDAAILIDSSNPLVDRIVP